MKFLIIKSGLLSVVLFLCLQSEAQKRPGLFGKKYILSVHRDFYVLTGANASDFDAFSESVNKTARASVPLGITGVKFEGMTSTNSLLGISYCREQYEIIYNSDPYYISSEGHYRVKSQVYTAHWKQYLNKRPLKYYIGFNLGYRRSLMEALRNHQDFSLGIVKKGSTITADHIQAGLDFGRTFLLARRIYLNIGIRAGVNLVLRDTKGKFEYAVDHYSYGLDDLQLITLNTGLGYAF